MSGNDVGGSEGAVEGTSVGVVDGKSDGTTWGTNVGWLEGGGEGNADGFNVGELEWARVGHSDGIRVGTTEGNLDGGPESKVNWKTEGNVVGFFGGRDVIVEIGDEDETLEDAAYTIEGIIDGVSIGIPEGFFERSRREEVK
jgi:hypothetical protein